jgi:flagellin-like hook-associated protein FlgL
VLQVALNARPMIGSTIQTFSNLSSSSTSEVQSDTTVQSNIEDTDIAKVTSEFTQTQTVLQTAHATTARLKGKTLFDYL